MVAGSEVTVSLDDYNPQFFMFSTAIAAHLATLHLPLGYLCNAIVSNS